MVGFIAAIFTTFAFLPQVIKVIKEQDTKSLSLGMCTLQFIGVSLWLTHGVLIKDAPLVIANTFTVLFLGIILFYKLKFK